MSKAARKEIGSEKFSIKERNEKLKKVELNLLTEFDKICKKHSIKYSLTFGTLLGAVRHKGFIPWDDDIDVMMTREDYNKFLKVANELPKNLFFQNNKTDCFKFDIFMAAKIRDNNSKVEFDKKYHSGAFIDIFVLDKFSSNKIPKSIQKLFYLFLRFVQYREKDDKKNIFKIIKISKILEKIFIRISANKNYKNFYWYWLKKSLFLSYNDIFPLREVEFEKKYFSAFRRTSYLLKFLYGDYMKLPPIEKRIGGHANLDNVEIN